MRFGQTYNYSIYNLFCHRKNPQLNFRRMFCNGLLRWTDFVVITSAIGLRWLAPEFAREFFYCRKERIGKFILNFNGFIPSVPFVQLL